MFKVVMPLNLEEGHLNISSFFRVFWSERGSALEYGEDFARKMISCLRIEKSAGHLALLMMCSHFLKYYSRKLIS